MRLAVETAKIKNGFARFPIDAPWLQDFIAELLAFPNSKNYDQVDSLVMALAWMTQFPEPGMLVHMRTMVEESETVHSQKPRLIRASVPPFCTYQFSSGSPPYQRTIQVGADGIVVATEEELLPLFMCGRAKRESKSV